ncbi:phage tail assembly protein [Pseudomonas sp. MF6747]|uniref:phage tail assembly protein n=1 Tax=Pseudomonas sp. MF6747 TaxID=2797527 RepID=UPI00190C3CDC|nr:phage tail assembly protein [Pseudomonas sp. MF6747]MBK3511317.1 phage tail assembly protein [Pseudomonas sp. MF6747]
MKESNANTLPEWLELTAAGAVVKLKYPLEVDGTKVDKIQMRAPCLRDLRAAGATTNGDQEQLEVNLLCSLTEIGEKDLGAIKTVDYKRLQEGYFRLDNEVGV